MNVRKSLPTEQPQQLALPQGPHEEIEKGLSLMDIWRVLVKRKATVIIFFLATVGLAAAYLIRKTPLYEGVARLDIDPERSANVGLEDVIQDKLGWGDASDRLQTEVRILQSDTNLLEVAKSLDLAHKRPFAGALAANPVTGNELTPVQRETLLQMMQGNLKAMIEPNTNLVEVRFRNSDPVLATQIANGIVDAYSERVFRARYQGTMKVSDWLSKQMEDVKHEANENQQKLAEFQKTHNFLGTDEDENIVTDKLRQLNQQVTDAEADRILKEARHRLAQTRNPELIASVAPNTTLQMLRSQQADLRAQYAQLSSKYGSGYPKVHELQQQLAKIDAAVDSEITNVGKRLEDEYLASKNTEDMLRQRLEGQKGEAFKLSESAGQYAILKHEAESTRELYDALQLRLKEAGVTAGLSSADIDIIDRAQVPSTPVSPNVQVVIVLALVFGVIGGIGLAFVLETLDDTVRTSDEVESISSLPSLGSIPSFAPRGSRNKLMPRRLNKQLPSRQDNVIALTEPRSHGAEAFRGLRSSILLTSIDNPPKILLISSALESEGKSTTSANTAVALAQSGANVLLVDCDLRRSSLQKFFGVSGAKGLTTILAGQGGRELFLTPIESLPNLHFLPAGPSAPNPAEMLGSNRMASLLNDWAKDFDHVIIDTAPILAVADSLTLAARASEVLLVVRAGVTRKKAILKVRDLLWRSNIRVAGVVVNDVDMRIEHFYTYSSSQKYGYKSSLTYGYHNND
jgi:polysaccharide biosynthesis transport protein